MALIMSWQAGGDGDRGTGLLAGFRGELYCSLGLRRDALFEACDALACRPERVHMLAELCLEPGVPPRARRPLRRAELRGGPDRAAAPGGDAVPLSP